MPALARAERNPYDHRHRQRAARMKRAALGTPCPGATLNGQPWRSPRCVGTMTRLDQMHADHATTPVRDGGTQADRVCCIPCNTGAGATAGNRTRGQHRARRRTRTW